MFRPPFYGSGALLSSGLYYNLLYQEGIRKDLLNVIANEFDFNPVFVLALHEGEPIDRVNRELDWNHSVSREKTREIGDVYLLVFAAVALRQYEQLGYDHRSAYVEEVGSFLESLRRDGYTYHDGYIYDANGAVVVPVPLGGAPAILRPAALQNEASQPAATAPAPVPDPEPVPEAKESANEDVATKREAPAAQGWSRGEKIAFCGLIIAIIAVFANIVSPEVRRFFHLDKSLPVAHEQKPPTTAPHPDINPKSKPSAVPQQKSTPSGPSAETGLRANATVVVHRASPQSGAHTAAVATTGNGEQEINLGAAPTKLMFTPPSVIVEKRELPKNIEVGGHTLTVVRYTNSGFVIDDHKHWDVHFSVYLLEGDTAP